MGTFGLSDFVLMVRKLQIGTTTVDVKMMA